MIASAVPFSSPRRDGLTLVECLVCCAIVGVAMVAAMRVLGASAGTLRLAGDRATARTLAEARMTEILAKAYRDPGAQPLFGPEAGESLTNPTSWNDVDDYNGYVESPPADPSGIAIPGVPAGWSRSVTVEWVSPSNPAQTSQTETGLKRITVAVKRGPVLLTTLVGYKGDLP